MPRGYLSIDASLGTDSVCALLVAEKISDRISSVRGGVLSLSLLSQVFYGSFGSPRPMMEGFYFIIV